jgi:fatty-acyl-CoA synthase
MISSSPPPHGGVAPASTRVMNLSHFLRQAARRHGAETGFVWGERTWTWADLDRRVDAMAAALSSKGIGKGDRVLVQSKNCNQMFESMFACFRLGAVWVPTNFRQTPGEVTYLAQASGASAMICHSDFPEHAEAVRSAIPDLRFIVSIGPSGFGEDYDALVRRHEGQSVPTAVVDRDSPCWFFFTSGTTGRPKAAVLTHGQMAFVITNHLCDLMPGTTHADASLVVAPLSHGAGVHQLVQVARAAKTVLLSSDRFDPDEAWSLVERWRITNMFTVPTIVKLLTEHTSVDAHDHLSLRYLIYAGAPMYREDQKHALKKLGKVLVQYFGLGEVTGNITVLPPGLHEPEDTPGVKAGTCGYERTGMQVSIQNDRGDEVPPGTTGEICVCGPAAAR